MTDYRTIAGRPVRRTPPRRPDGRDLEWMLGPMFLASGLFVGWLLFEALEFLPW